MPGGKRAGAGRKSEFSQAQKQELFAKAAELWSVDAPQDMPELYAALRDLARGTKVLSKIEWKGRRRLLIETEEGFEDSFGQPCWLYTTLPNLAAAKFLVEKASGKAAQQPQQTVDTTINLIHSVPRPARRS